MSSAFMHGANAKRGSVHKVLLTPSLICNQTLISNLVAHEKAFVRPQSCRCECGGDVEAK